MSSFIPNAYQTPNVYLDKYMGRLTSDEWVVLSYAVRRIFGFGKQNVGDHISLSQFAKGITGLDYGTGLSKNTCIKCLNNLVTYGLLIKIDDKSRKGTFWNLQSDTDQVNEALIESKYQQRKQVNKKKAKNFLPVHETNQEFTPRTDEEFTPRTNNITVDKQNNINISDAGASHEFEESLQPPLIPTKKKKPRKPNPVYEAVEKLQELEPSFSKGHGLKVVKELFEQGYTEEQIINCGKDIQQREWWIENNIKLSPNQIKKYIADFANAEKKDEFGNVVETLPDDTQVITLSSEIKQDSNIVVIE